MVLSLGYIVVSCLYRRWKMGVTVGSFRNIETELGKMEQEVEDVRDAWGPNESIYIYI